MMGERNPAEKPVTVEKPKGAAMSKTSIKPTNDFCPQTLFLYGTYDDEGRPDFGLFCWFSYIWDGELGVMACIGGEKLAAIAPVRTTCNRYFGWGGADLGAWGEPGKIF